MKIFTCSDLEQQGLWNTSKCCRECHGGGQTMCPGMDDYKWLGDDVAHICCNAYWFFYGLRHDPYDKSCSDYLYRNREIEKYKED